MIILQEVLRWAGHGTTAWASLALAMPALHYPAVSGTSQQSTLDALNITTPLSTVANQGPYSPFLLQPTDLPREVPSGWEVDQVSILMRHGARAPTASAAKKIAASLALLERRTSIKDPALAFVDGYTFTGFKADALTDFGRRECFDAGTTFRREYANLADGLFVRSASDGRVVESSGFFLQGWAGSAFDLNTTLPLPEVIVTEANGFNSTLSVSTCTTDEELDPSYGDVAHINWQAVYAPPILKRLEAALPGTNLTAVDLNYIMSVCGFESVRNLRWKQSPWCSVFTPEEWKQHEYYYDLDKYYGHSGGSPYGKASGIGYVNELLARLTAGPVHLGASVNATLDSALSTFPLNRTIYVDFSHDNDMVTILTTLGVLDESDLHSAPKRDSIPEHRFIVSSLVPFAGRFVFERLVAPDGGKYIRIILNGAVLPLTLPGCGSPGRKYGLCDLGQFVKHQAAYTQATPSQWDQLCYAPAVNRKVPL